MNGIVSKSIKAVIFDLDGTLVDSEPNYFEADKKVLMDYGIFDFNMEMKKKYIGIGTKDMMRDMKAKYHINESIEKLVAMENEYYIEFAKMNTIVFPEMLMLLEFLKNNNYPLAIASGSSPEVIDIVLSITNLKDYFDVVLSAEQVKRGKPEPDVFLEAAKQLCIPFRNCLVVEDSQFGVEAAKSASMYCAAIPSLIEEPLHESFCMADLLFKTGIAEFRKEKVVEWLKKVG
jgi:HAD superfamily hydrolase (TIGR01509 family)